ncbi:phosphatidate cytidylyltransferase [Actinoplanes sp. NPDC051851]|uniref:phosphatidate cytidylyltransferase n=1 Tax=Actinoplanes sp. NPDC051851 TaxID=3154753 RepID=UPI003447C8D6
MLTVFDTAPYVAGVLSVGGVGVVISRRRELILRWATWAVTAPLLGAAMLLGRPGAAALATGLALAGLLEYRRLVRLPIPDTIVVAVALTATIVTAGAPRVLAVAALAVVLTPVLAGDGVNGAARSAYAVLGFAWLATLTGLVTLGDAALPLFVAVSLADVAAWCCGKAFGGPRLSPLSPGKRWLGVLGGALAGIGTLAVCDALTPALIIAVVVGAPLGDLLESMLKRGAGVKDAGTWLPGFGGLLDRIDSLLIALALAVILS